MSSLLQQSHDKSPRRVARSIGRRTKHGQREKRTSEYRGAGASREFDIKRIFKNLKFQKGRVSQCLSLELLHNAARSGPACTAELALPCVLRVTVVHASQSGSSFPGTSKARLPALPYSCGYGTFLRYHPVGSTGLRNSYVRWTSRDAASKLGAFTRTVFERLTGSTKIADTGHHRQLVGSIRCAPVGSSEGKWIPSTDSSGSSFSLVFTT